MYGATPRLIIYEDPHSTLIYKFPIFLVFSLSNWKCFVCQFLKFVAITFTSETDLKKQSKILHQILQYPVSLESGNLLLEQTKFLVFWLFFFQIPCVVPDGIFWAISLFSLAVGTPLHYNMVIAAIIAYSVNYFQEPPHGLAHSILAVGRILKFSLLQSKRWFKVETSPGKSMCS